MNINLTFSEDIDTILEKLIEVSPYVETYINDRQYEQDINDDDVTEEILIDKAYRLIINELQELGINFTVDIDELLESSTTANVIYVLRQVFDGAYLKEIIRTNEYIRNILDTLANDDDTIDDLIIPCIELFINKIGGSTFAILKLTEASTLITSNIFFKKHLIAVLEESIVSIFPEVDVTITTPFLIYLENHRKRNYENIYALEKLDPDLDTIRLQHKLKVHDLEKISGKMFNIFAMLYTIEESGNEDNYTDELITYAKKIDEAHHEGNTHHIEYYKKHDIHPTKTDIAELVSDASAKSNSINDFKKRINHIVNTVSFSLNERALIEKYAVYLIPLLEKTLKNIPEIIVNDNNI